MSDIDQRLDDLLVAVMVDGWDFDFTGHTTEVLCALHDRVRVLLWNEKKPTTYAKGWFKVGTLSYRRDDMENTIRRLAISLSEHRERKVPDAEKKLRNTLRFANPAQLRLIMKGLSMVSEEACKAGDQDTVQAAARLLALCPGLPEGGV